MRSKYAASARSIEDAVARWNYFNPGAEFPVRCRYCMHVRFHGNAIQAGQHLEVVAVRGTIMVMHEECSKRLGKRAVIPMWRRK